MPKMNPEKLAKIKVGWPYVYTDGSSGDKTMWKYNGDLTWDEMWTNRPATTNDARTGIDADNFVSWFLDTIKPLTVEEYAAFRLTGELREIHCAEHEN
jgi:hypothetical protein